MWMDKLFDGVLELDTPSGPRYVELTFAQRAYMMWTFRNFLSLPEQVLRPWERRLIGRLWNENRFVAVPATGAPSAFVIGRVERQARAQAEVLSIRNLPMHQPSMRKPVSGTQSAATESREAASA